MEPMKYMYIVSSKITGAAISRHTSRELAQAAVARKTTEKNPLEAIYYSDEYWKYHRPLRKS